MTIQEMHSWFDVLQDKGDSPYFTIDEKTQFLNRAMTKYVNSVLHRIYLTSGKSPENNSIPYSSMESVQAGEDALQPIITRLESNTSTIITNYNSSMPKVNQYGQVHLSMLNDYAKEIAHAFHGSSAFPNLSTWDQVKVLHVIGIRWWANQRVPLRYIRFGDISKLSKNSFTSPTVEDPVYFLQKSDRYEILPRASADGTSFGSLYDNGALTLATQPDTDDYARKCKLIISVVRTPCPLRYDPLDSDNNVDCELPDWTHDDIMAIALDDAGVASRDQSLLSLNQAAKANLTPPQ